MLTLVAQDATIRVEIIMVSGIKRGDETKINRGVMLSMSKKLKLLDRGLSKTYQAIQRI